MSIGELTGGCLCGAVRYRTGTPNVPPTLCHCASCRRATGAHAVGLYTVTRATAEFTAGKQTEYRSSSDVLRGFCGECGTSLTYWHARWPENLSFTISSLDNPGLAVPIDHTGMADAAPWDVPGDGLPQSLDVRPE
jgi:hypothetical protein